MDVPGLTAESLADWLHYLESLHPSTIEMGLERVANVRSELGLIPRFPIITVGGTNGKGSVCAMLEAILQSAGYKVGCYTSPHLVRFNERIRIDGKEIDSESLCLAFSQVEVARRDCHTPLTFFEFSTLAAMRWFIQTRVDVAILEIGLGGRLDAVNIFDPDCAILTSIDLDHMEYLGNTREEIGFEKAAIFRQSKPAICAEIDIPDSVYQQARKIEAHLSRFSKEFGFQSKINQWDYWGPRGWRHSLPVPTLRGDKQLQNASACLAALDEVNELLPVNMKDIRQGLIKAAIPGRFQVVSTQPMIILDVAHNPAAAAVLAQNLTATQCAGRTYAVFSMLQDKDIQGVVQKLKDEIDVWLLFPIQSPRAATVEHIVQEIHAADFLRGNQSIYRFSDGAEAFAFACEQAAKNDRICIFGSFYTVGDVLNQLHMSS
ncbi:bifunctional tetrahydrofolate synthase/dihydrofolate synthase [Nitrosomonas sp.]|uniref:bifunctional tetrahydrofolate synthase/dihydrofolate synthase n=1 Tax=Nitrosomonas sp. TaxID=42353 RepID=UPI0025E4CE1E|nr:bifunctional tetrahydrofolate synthase/dihydrofolate synthase [Nitrosomonas sp.]